MRISKNVMGWLYQRGSFDLELDSRHVRGQVVTEGASVFVVAPEAEYEQTVFLIGSGRGHLNLDVWVPEGAVLRVAADKPTFQSGIYLSQLVRVQPPGWCDGESYVQLDVKARDAVPADIQALIDRQNINALRREAALRAEIEKLKQR